MPDLPTTSSPQTPPPVRPKMVLGYRSAWRRMMVRLSRRDNFMNSLRSLAWVVPLTLVIWIYAEREQTAEVSGVTFTFAIKSNDPNFVLTLQQDHNIEVGLTGPRAQVDEVARILRSEANGEPPIEIDVDPQKPETLKLDTYDKIYNNPIFSGHGVSVERDKVSPRQLVVDADRLEEHDVAVKAPSTVKGLENPPIFDPPTVKVKAPAAAFERAREADGKVYVYAAIADLDVLKQPGHHEINSVAVNWPIPNDANVSISPPSVKAIVDVKQADVEYEIPAVPIFLLAPAGLLDQYHVQYSPTPTMKNVKVIGPADKINLIKDETKVSVRGLLTITNSDVGAGEVSRTLRYDLPDGVRVSDDDARKLVTFTLTPRSSTP